MGIRVASVPSGHVYVRHLAAEGGDGVERLPDPRPGTNIPDAQWWPPRMLESTWVREHAGDFDLMHVHFGFDATSPESCAELVGALRAESKPLVLTVHDLRNPHHLEPGLHDAQLSVLVAAADALITLTPGAAAEIRSRWGREARVLPHPHVVEEPVLSRPRPGHDGFVIGIHAKSLRASMDPLPVVEAIVEVLAQMPGARLRVDAHTDVMTPVFPRHAPELADGPAHARGGRAGRPVRARLLLRRRPVGLLPGPGPLGAALPLRHATRAGSRRATTSGTAVAAPDCGFYAEQRPCLTYAGRAGPRAHGQPAAGRAARPTSSAPHWRADPAARRAGAGRCWRRRTAASTRKRSRGARHARRDHRVRQPPAARAVRGWPRVADVAARARD